MKTSHFFLVASILLALVFTFSCSSGDDEGGGGGGGTSSDSGSGTTSSPSGGGNENSQIYNTDSTLFTDSGVIKILVIKYGYYDTLAINAGSVTNGIVNLELPTTTLPDEYVGDKYLDGSGDKCGYTHKTHSSGTFILTNNSGEHIGRLDYSYNKGFEYITYEYFSKAQKIACNAEGGIYDIDAKIGWNKIYNSWQEDGNTHFKVSTNNILTKGKEMKWWIEL